MNGVDDKMIGCAAIILAGLSYQDKDNYLNSGLNLLKKIIKFSLIIMVFLNQEI